jgi:hypothetical protein
MRHARKVFTSRFGRTRGGNCMARTQCDWVGKAILQAAEAKDRGSSAKLHPYGERKEHRGRGNKH